MQNDIFSLLMMILMMENGGGTESINQLIIMFLMMNARAEQAEAASRTNPCHAVNCGREEGFTF